MLFLFAIRLVGAFTIIDHDKVEAIPSNVDPSHPAAIHLPSLALVDGRCAPYPAVDINGQVSGGLAGTSFFSLNDKCKAPKHVQVYSRLGHIRDQHAIVYTWYMPQEVSGNVFVKGQRHIWKTAVLWFKRSYDQVPDYISLNVDGVYRPLYKYRMKDNRVLLGTHFRALQPTSKIAAGGVSALLDYDKLSDAPKQALEEYTWGSKQSQYFPLNTDHFYSTLIAAL